MSNLVNESILENIAFAKDRADINISEAWNALDSAKLKKLVEDLPEGINTITTFQ